MKPKAANKEKEDGLTSKSSEEYGPQSWDHPDH